MSNIRTLTFCLLTALCADAREKLAYELYYLARRSLPFDLTILLRTLPALFGHPGR